MRKVIVSIVIGFIALLSIPSSSAHVEIVSSFPERFANVNPFPTQVWIQFSGDLQTLEGQVVNSLEVIDSTGIAVNFEVPVIEGDYTFNASPDYAEAVPTNTSIPDENSSLNIGGIVLVVFLIIFVVSYIIKEKKNKK